MRKQTWEIRLVLCGEKRQNFAKALSLCARLMQCADLSRGVMDEVFHGTYFITVNGTPAAHLVL